MLSFSYFSSLHSCQTHITLSKPAHPWNSQRRGGFPGASTTLCPDTMSLYLGLTRQSHLLLQPIPVSTELTNPSLRRCCEMHLLSMDELHAFSCILSFCPQFLFPRVKHTSCVCSHISVSSQHPTPHTALTHYTPKSKYCLKFSVLFT